VRCHDPQALGHRKPTMPLNQVGPSALLAFDLTTEA
jgi:hypothetical protein